MELYLKNEKMYVMFNKKQMEKIDFETLFDKQSIPDINVYFMQRQVTYSQSTYSSLPKYTPVLLMKGKQKYVNQ